MKQSPVEQNAFETVQRTCKIAGIKVTTLGLQEKLLEHPTFPSMQSLKDTFTSLNVPNLAVRIEPSMLEKVTTPLIVYLNGGLGYGIVQKADKNFVEWHHNNLGVSREPLTEFSRKWQGVSLVVEPNKQSGETDFAKKKHSEKKKKLKKLLRILSVISLIILWLIVDPKINLLYYKLIVSLHLIGIVISIILVQISIGKYEEFWRDEDKINFASKSETILRSKFAQILPGVNWSEICLMFFSGGLLFMLTSKAYDQSAIVLRVLNYIVVIYAAWILILQLKLRQICISCIKITILLISETLLLQNVTSKYSIDLYSLAHFIVSFFIPIIAWAFIKPLIKSASLSKGHYNKIRQIMFNPIYLRSILSEKKDIPPLFKGMNKLAFGSDTANNTITLILNPICHVCRNKFLQIQQLTSENLEVRCEIIFGVSSSPESIDNIAAVSILGSNYGEEIEVMKEWYKDMPVNVKGWFQLKKIDQSKGSKQLIYHHRWNELSALHSKLPIIILNGSELPYMYKISDINSIINIGVNKKFS